MVLYYWLAFAFSLWCLLRIPSRMAPINNLSGSLLCALFGFALWPLYALAAFRATKEPTHEQ